MALRSATRNKTIKHGAGKKNGRQQSAVNIQLVEQLRELAWTGQHAPAINLATQALSTPKIKPAVQMDLLDLRVESYIAQGKLDLAAKDAKAMGKLAKTAALKAQALN